MRFYAWAFAAEPALADDLKNGHRYNAARIAVLAAAGEDEEMTAFGVEEWGHLTGLALKWLRADLALLASRAKDPKRWPEVRERLTHWKEDPDLALGPRPGVARGDAAGRPQRRGSPSGPTWTRCSLRCLPLQPHRDPGNSQRTPQQLHAW